jgi:hypothetical protein
VYKLCLQGEKIECFLCKKQFKTVDNFEQYVKRHHSSSSSSNETRQTCEKGVFQDVENEDLPNERSTSFRIKNSGILFFL